MKFTQQFTSLYFAATLLVLLRELLLQITEKKHPKNNQTHEKHLPLQELVEKLFQISTTSKSCYNTW